MSGLSPNCPTLVPQASTQLQGDRAVTKITTCMLAGPNIPIVQRWQEHQQLSGGELWRTQTGCIFLPRGLLIIDTNPVWSPSGCTSAETSLWDASLGQILMWSIPSTVRWCQKNFNHILQSITCIYVQCQLPMQCNLIQFILNWNRIPLTFKIRYVKNPAFLFHLYLSVSMSINNIFN